METAEGCVKRLPPGNYVIIADQHPPRRISIKSPAKQIVFQIGYDDDKGSTARETLFRSFGHEVFSLTHNHVANRALPSIPNLDLLILCHAAPQQTQKQLVHCL